MLKPVLLLAALLLSVSSFAKDKIPYANAPLCFIENTGQVTDQDHRPRKDIQFSVRLNDASLFIGNSEMHYQWHKLDKSHLPEANGRARCKIESSYRMDVELVGANKKAKFVTEQKVAYSETYLSSTGRRSNAYEQITYKNIYPNIDWVLQIREGKLKHEFVVNEGGNPSDIQLRYKGATALYTNADGSLTAKTPLGSISEQAPYSYTDGATVPTRFVLKDDVLSFEVGKYSGRLVIDPDIIWATYYGGNDGDGIYDIAVDNNGNVFACGQTMSMWSIATAGAHQQSGGWIWSTGFLVKFNPAGIREWGTYYGGEGWSSANAVATDASGNVFMVGQTESDTGIATPGSYQDTMTSMFSGQTSYLVKFNATGQRIWGTYFGDGMFTYISDVCSDPAGNVYVSGSTKNDSIISTPGSHQENYADSTDGFIVKFNPAGQRQWGSYYGGNRHDDLNGISYCIGGYICAVGTTKSTTGIAAGNVHQVSNLGQEDAFVIKFDTTGNRIWATYMGGEKPDLPNSIACDQGGNVMITGRTTSTSYIGTTGAFRSTKLGSAIEENCFLTRFNSFGSRLWGTYFGGSLTRSFVAVAPNGHIFLSGHTQEDTLIATPGSYQDQGDINQDAYLVEFDQAGQRLWGTYYGGLMQEYCSGVACSPAGDVYFVGQTTSSTGIATTEAHQMYYYGGGQLLTGDGFIAKFGSCTPPSMTGGGLTGDLVVCPGSTHTYSVTPVAGATAYAWYSHENDQVVFTVDTFCHFTFDNYVSGLYVKAINQCGVGFSDTLNAGLKYGYLSYPANYLCVPHATPISMSTNWTTVQWQKDGVDIPGANSFTYLVSQLGTYRAYTLDTDCGDTSSNVTFNSMVTVQIPVINYIGASLTTGTYQTYKWYKDGSVIPGATSAWYTNPTPGFYNVQVGTGGTYPCTAMSDTFVIYPVSVNTVNEQPQLNIYPNPGKGRFVVDFVAIENEPLKLSVVDITGRIVYAEDIQGTKEAIRTQMELGHLSAGSYILQVTSEHSRNSLRFTILP